MSHLVRCRFVACTLLAGLAVVGCGASESRSLFGADSTDSGRRNEAGDEVVLPDEDAGADAAPGGDDGYALPKCGSALKDTANGSVCIRVLKGADGPHIDTASRAQKIDGEGVLVIALMPDPWLRTSKAVTVHTFPSASSSTHFVIATDLPKTAELEVPPGRYIAVASFYDQPGFGSRDYMAGDFVPKMEGGWILPHVEVAAGTGLDVEVPIFPVRQIDVTAVPKTGLRPLGSGSGPVRVSLWTKDSGVMVGEGRLACADVFNTRPVVHLITTDLPGVHGVRAALYDFAAGPDDPMIDGNGAPPPGSVVDYDGTTATATLTVTDGWLSPPAELSLDRVIAFEGPIPVDPSPSCTPYSAAPAK